MTPLHARPKAYRNLYNARRVTNREETEAALERQFREETVRIVDEGWKAFWAKRGIKKPPHVSDQVLGVFDIL
jgi:ribosomal protein L31E